MTSADRVPARSSRSPRGRRALTGSLKLSWLVCVDDAFLLVVLRTPVVAELGDIELLVGDEGTTGHPFVDDPIRGLEVVASFLSGGDAVGDRRSLLLELLVEALHLAAGDHLLGMAVDMLQVHLLELHVLLRAAER